MGRSFLLLAALVYRAQCFSDRDLINEANPTKTMCYERRPVYGPPEMGNGGFVIKSTLVSELNGKYTPGQQYSLDLIGLVAPYEGFVIQARDRWNEGLILGSFIPLDTSKAQTIRCLGNEQGTVIHKTKDPVSVQSFIWQAPPTSVGSGEVDFIYSVVQSSSVHHRWIGPNTVPHNMGHRRDASAAQLNDMMMNSSNSSDEDMELHMVMVRVHGVVMTVAFSIFGVIGIFFAAWMKPVLTQNSWWFKLHRGMMIASLLLGTFGFICIFVAHSKETFRGLKGLVRLDNPKDIIHFGSSFVIMLLLFANPVIAIFRCKPDAPRRWIYNLIHGAIVGLVFEVLVLVNSCLGIILLLGGLGAMFYIYLFFVIFTVVMNIVLGFAIICSGDTNLPAVVKLLHTLLEKNRNTAHVEDDASNLKTEEDVLLADAEVKTSSIKAFIPAPTSTPPPRLNVLRWAGFGLYITISLPLLFTVIVMIIIVPISDG